MAYNALKSVDLTNFMNILMCFLVSCSNRGGQVSPVRNMAFCRILSSCVQFKIVWLILCSSFSPQGYIELEIILILWWYDLVKPWPITIAVNSAEIGIVVFILSFMYGKNNVCVCVCVCVCVLSPRGCNPKTESSSWWKKRGLALEDVCLLFGWPGPVTPDSYGDCINKLATLPALNAVVRK